MELVQGEPVLEGQLDEEGGVAPPEQEEAAEADDASEHLRRGVLLLRRLERLDVSAQVAAVDLVQVADGHPGELEGVLHLPGDGGVHGTLGELAEDLEDVPRGEAGPGEEEDAPAGLGHQPVGAAVLGQAADGGVAQEPSLMIKKKSHTR